LRLAYFEVKVCGTEVLELHCFAIPFTLAVLMIIIGAHRL